MQIHDLKPKNKITKKKRVGRGGKRGTYSGKGMKGQKSRAGANMAPIARELIKRYPKLRGYNFSPLNKTFVINIAVLDKVFEKGGDVNRKILVEKKIIGKSKNLPIKILGNGETKKKFNISECSVSKKAKEIIEKAGGSIKEEKPVVKKNVKKEVKKTPQKKVNKK